MSRPLQGLAGLLITAALLSACQTIDWPLSATEPADPPAPQASSEIVEQALEEPSVETSVESPTETAAQTPEKSLFGSFLGTLKGILAKNPEETPEEALGETEVETQVEAPAQAPESQAPTEPETAAIAVLPVPAGALPTPPPATPVPHIYLALQPDGEGKPISAIFAIDAARDNTPSDDPAIRLTPENGLCNPQEMRSYSFPREAAASPVVSETQQAQGLTVADLPAFMAVSVTDRMLSLGLASNREQTRALNICTRKLWEELVLSGNQAALPAGQ